MPDGIEWSALARFLSGECSPGESAEIQRWIDADPAHRELIASMRVVWDRPAPPELDPHDALWARIAARMRAAPGRPVVARGEAIERIRAMGRRRPIGYRTILAVAASLVLAVAVGRALSRLVLVTARPPRPAAMRTVATQRGQRAALDLADGSRVILSAASTLRIPPAFGDSGSARDVYLDGQAYFDVQHDSTRPFRVHTRTGVAEDIGTSFVVTDYPDMRGMRVVVSEGTVALALPVASRRAPLVTLRRGDLARLDPAGTATVTRGVNVAAYLAWTQGGLAFEGAQLRHVVRELTRWYDVDITLADNALGARRVTASFEGEPIDRVLQRLALALNLRVERHGSSVVLYPGPPRAPGS
jgi:transmembrane sensor